jgi:hypothetical protein
MFADFMQFYNYKAEEALNEYAKRFFGLCGSMYRLKAKDNLIQLINLSNGMAGGKEARKLADLYSNQAEGNDKILREIRNIKK